MHVHWLVPLTLVPRVGGVGVARRALGPGGRGRGRAPRAQLARRVQGGPRGRARLQAHVREAGGGGGPGVGHHIWASGAGGAWGAGGLL